MNFRDIFLDTSVGNDLKDQDHEQLTALVYDPDFFTENSSQFESYFGDNGERTGWSLILRGLIHPDSLAQKKSLYLLKRLVEHLKLDLNYFTNYFLVLETVDEKQAHIVKQISGHIKNLWSNYHLGKQEFTFYLFQIILTEKTLHIYIYFRLFAMESHITPKIIFASKSSHCQICFSSIHETF